MRDLHEGVERARALLLETKRRAKLLESYFRQPQGSLRDLEMVEKADIAEIEAFVLALSQLATGSSHIEPKLWVPALDCANQIVEQETRRHFGLTSSDPKDWSASSKGEYFRGFQIWADRTERLIDAMSVSGSEWLHRRAELLRSAAAVERPGDLFISYRRADTLELTSRLYERLVARAPKAKVFRDLDSISPGSSFPTAIRQALASTAVGVVVVGPRWLSVMDDAGRRRLDDPADYVRLEVETMLAMDIPVVPCLVAGVAMPYEEDLPPSLRPLLERQHAVVRSDPDFSRDIDRLLESLDERVPALALKAEVVLQRKADGWWSGMEANDWSIMGDGRLVVALHGNATVGSAPWPVGQWTLRAVWKESQRGSHERQSGYWPGYASSGETACITAHLAPGRHVFTLVKEGNNERGLWSFFSRSMEDSRPRSLNLLAFEPPGWPSKERYL
jgi:hypothetical protein